MLKGAIRSTLSVSTPQNTAFPAVSGCVSELPVNVLF